MKVVQEGSCLVLFFSADEYDMFDLALKSSGTLVITTILNHTARDKGTTA